MSPIPRAAFVALGSNLDDPRAQVLSAFAALARIPSTTLVARSRLYRSAPLGPVDQPPFVNAVAHLATTLGARSLLDRLLEIERAHGRERGAKWGPRTLDLDLVVYGDSAIDEEGLTVPHPGLTDRAFVLYPLAEVAPTLDVPGAGPITTLLTRVSADGLAVLDD